MTRNEAIERIKTSCYLVGYPTNDKEYETRKAINQSLYIAVLDMRKVEKIEQIVNAWNNDASHSFSDMCKIKVVLEQE